jgi:hypothetical protein
MQTYFQITTMRTGDNTKPLLGNSSVDTFPSKEAATKRRLLKTEKTFCVLVTFEVCNSVSMSQLFVVTFCKCSINRISNPNPVYSQSRENIVQTFHCKIIFINNNAWHKVLIWQLPSNTSLHIAHSPVFSLRRFQSKSKEWICRFMTTESKWL